MDSGGSQSTAVCRGHSDYSLSQEKGFKNHCNGWRALAVEEELSLCISKNRGLCPGNGLHNIGSVDAPSVPKNYERLEIKLFRDY